MESFQPGTSFSLDGWDKHSARPEYKIKHEIIPYFAAISFFRYRRHG